MSTGKAFIFDTNFIIKMKKLDDVCDALKDKFHVYVTQVSIDERIAQQCREAKRKYDDLPSLIEKYQEIALITVTKHYNKFESDRTKAVQKLYGKHFKNAIIPYKKDGATFSQILDRSSRKLPPFNTNENSSDKGFKDTLMWLSLLEFFKSQGESEIIFVTDDDGFLSSKEFLQNEFCEITGKKIEIKQSSYYKELTVVDSDNKTVAETKTLPDFRELRSSINKTFSDICGFWADDDWGEATYYKTFILYKKVDATYVENMLDNLSGYIEKHIFDKYIHAYFALDLDKRMAKGNGDVSIECFEKTLKVYENIKKNYNNYLAQFFATISQIINENYVTPPVDFIDDDDMPF